MSEAPLVGSGSEGSGAQGTGPGGQEPARMGAVQRFVSVFFSPGAVFEDLRRSTAGWWMPIVICAVVTGIFASIYVSRYDLAVVVKEQLKESSAMKLVSGLQGPAARDKAIEMALKEITQTPPWQLQVSQWTNAIVGYTLMVWFFMFLYSLIALAMGWLGAARSSRLFVNLGIVAVTGIVFLCITGGLQVARGIAAKSAGGSPGDMPPPSTWMGAVTIAASVGAALLILWSLSRLAREGVFARILGVVSYSLAPTALAALLGIIIVLIKTPDATPVDDIVPANLTALLNLKEGNAALASLGSSLGLFAIWSAALSIIGLAKALGRKTGEAAILVLAPWGAWILIKVLFAALLG